MDFDDINIAGVVFGVLGFGIGIVVAKGMQASITMRIIAGIICGIANYFIGSKIMDG